MASEAGSEGQRPVFITAQPNGLGIGKIDVLGYKESVVLVDSEGPTARLIIAQPAGLGIYVEIPCGLKARVITSSFAMTRAFSPHDLLPRNPALRAGLLLDGPLALRSSKNSGNRPISYNPTRLIKS